MSLVFRLARKITVLVEGGFSSKAPRTKSETMLKFATSISDTAHMPEVLRVDALTAGYGGTIVVDDVSFSLEENGGIALLGRNGVGKTTLLSTLMGHTHIRSGKIVLAGRDISALPSQERPLLAWGSVPQNVKSFGR